MDLNDSYCNNSPESQDLLQDMSDNNIASSSTGITSFSLVARNRKPSIVTPYFTKKTKNDVNSPIVSDTLPFSTIESKALIALLHFLNATLELPLHETIKLIVQNSFILMRNDVQALFEQIPRMTPIKTSIEKVCRFVKAITLSSTIIQDFKEIGQSVDEAVVMRYHNNLAYYKLTPQEDFDLQVVTQFLQPFYEVTKILSNSIYITLELSIFLMNDIVDVIRSCIQDSLSLLFLKTAATQMLKKLNQYIVYIYNKAAFIASVLDHQIKLELISINMNISKNYDFFNDIFQDYQCLN
ncbi:14942_t:CDS:2 [Dentiscutata heterogama]|uniref:14942_t:CDS:1 n=1 Tax=Dentiscutata heterogama TaxID=1316150 RepID=A0ACA9JYY8_9GLOM|nr:14942_t:CDS:2 [Dentiscutata heterogama]